MSQCQLRYSDLSSGTIKLNYSSHVALLSFLECESIMELTPHIRIARFMNYTILIFFCNSNDNI